MDLVEEVAALVGLYEGCASCHKDGLIYAYICPAGYATQGYGIRVKDLNVPPITKEEAKERFKTVLPIYIKHAVKQSPNLVYHPQRLIAISSFIFNLGPAAYASSTLKKRVNAGQWELAAKEIKKWDHGGGRVLAGLTKRRLAESKLLLA